MKGILLAGGNGTRLRPLTLVTSKHLLAVYDKPLIYYPLSTLMLAGIRDIMIISTPVHLSLYQHLLGDGTQWGLHFTYLEQKEPRGPADALRIGRAFIDDQPVCLILGDNIFFGDRLISILYEATQLTEGAIIFAREVDTPQNYGVVEISDQGTAIGLEEAPAHPRSNFAVPGIYFYDESAAERAARLRPSRRGELEIVDLNRDYLEQGKLRVDVLDREIIWLDAGTHQTLLQAGNIVQAMQEQKDILIGSPDEVSFRMKLINKDQLSRLIQTLGKNSYASSLRNLLATSPNTRRE
jgi:glucose-1-phosphate thymidylyltransferase